MQAATAPFPAALPCPAPAQASVDLPLQLTAYGSLEAVADAWAQRCSHLWHQQDGGESHRLELPVRAIRWRHLHPALPVDAEACIGFGLV